MVIPSFKDIMAEQTEQSRQANDAEKIRKAADAEIQKAKQGCATVSKIEIRTEAVCPGWIKRNFYNLDQIIYSLRVPERKSQTVRYAYCMKNEQGEMTLEQLLGTWPHFVVEMERMYTSYKLYGWFEDNLYKILEFNKTACPSGGCDGESVHQLVGVSADDVLGLIHFVKIYKDDRQKILDAFEQIRVMAEKKLKGCGPGKASTPPPS
jgi:hypothetical protein